MTPLSLTAAERAWLADHPRIRIGYDGAYAPYSFADSQDGFIGIAPDFVRAIGALTGLRFEAVPELSWPEILDGTRKRDLDVIATAVRTPERQAFLDFTQIYIPTPLVVMARRDDGRIGVVEDIDGLTVALVEGYSSSARILDERPRVVPRFVTTPLEGLQALAIGEVDAYVGVLGVNAYLRREHGLTNLKVATRYDLRSNGQRFAVRKDWPELASILDKALSRMPLRQKNDIVERWVPILEQTERAAKHAPKFTLSDREAAWLAEHRDIRVGIMDAWPPMDYLDDKGNPKGIGLDFIELLNRRLNGALRAVPGPWVTILADLGEGRLDALMDITPRPDREARFHFTAPYVTVPHVIFARETSDYFGGLADLTGRSVAVEQGFFIVDALKAKFPDIEVKTYPTTSDALDAVAKGAAEAYVGNRAVATFILRNELIDGIVEHGKIDEVASVNAIAVRKDWPILRDILQKALDSIALSERRAVLKDWVNPQAGWAASRLRLTRSDRAWLDAHPVIKVAGGLARPPIEFTGPDGRYQGLAADYLDRLSAMLGVRFEADQGQDWSTAKGRMEAGALELLPAAVPTEERARFALFTKPYLSLPAVIFTRDDVSYVGGLENLAKRKVAVVEGHAVTDYLRKGHWAMELVELPDVAAALEALQNREAFAYLGSILVTSHYLRAAGHGNLVVSGQTPYRIEYAMAVHRGAPKLAAILETALAAMPEQQHAEIAGKWIGTQVSRPTDYSLVWKSAIGAAAILLLFLGWNSYLQRKTAVQGGELRLKDTALQAELAERASAERRAVSAEADTLRAEAQLLQAQKMEAVGQLTGGVAHDFNNLLAVIQGNVDLLANTMGKDDVSVAAISRAAARGGELTHRLLAFSRRQTLSPRAIELDSLVENMSTLLDRTLGETITVKTTAQAGLWKAFADPGQVENALLNLAINARDGMPAGGTLRIESTNARLDGADPENGPVALAGDFVVLSVCDNGTGMTPTVLERAFEPFFTTKGVGQGSGLGLSMVYGFAKQSGGDVTITSEVGQGTQVAIYLPRAEGAGRAEAPRSTDGIPRGRGEVILVVEDDEDVRGLTVRLLQRLGYQAIAAADAASALAVLDRGQTVDLLLSDVVLPGTFNGLELAERAQRDNPALKTVFMSGYPDDAAQHGGLLSGDLVLLSKPFQLHQLAKTLRATLDPIQTNGPSERS